MELIDGNQIAATIVAELKAQIAALPGRKPCIALVRVGDDPASVSYDKKKENNAADISIESRIIIPLTTNPLTDLAASKAVLHQSPDIYGITALFSHPL